MIRVEDEIKQRIKALDKELKEMRPAVLQRASELLEYDVSVSSLHGIIGGKYEDYTKVKTTQYITADIFKRVWVKGLLEQYEAQKWKTYDCSIKRVVKLYMDDIVRSYILTYIERDFYIHYNERTRQKPLEELWELWFCERIPFGIYITLAQDSEGAFRVDKSEIRKVAYQYWTIGHILSVGGFVDGNTNTLYSIKNIDDLLKFYQHILSGLSNSKYEKDIYERYVSYLKSSPCVEDEPFLIPELRYTGKEVHHEYRLDFAICNPYTFEFIGFELSPASSHMRVQKLEGNKLKDINQDLAGAWEKECDKRNEYFKKYGITIITFTDKQLQNIDECFEQIKSYLQRRPEKIMSVDEYTNEIRKQINNR